MKDFDLQTYDFSDCREITGEELYLINGGERVENSNEAVANAQVGDTVERKDGTVVTITQGDIDWAKEHTGTEGDNTSQTTPAASEPAPESQPSTPTNSSSTTGSTSQANTTNSSSSPTQSSTISKSSNLTDRGYPSSTEGYSNTRSNRDSSSTKTETKVPVFVDPFTPQSNGNYEIDNENKTVIADINNVQSVMDASGSYAILGDRGYTFQLREGNKVVHTFTDEKTVKNYVRTIDVSEGNLSCVTEVLGNISTATGVSNKALDYAVDYIDDISKVAKITSLSQKLSKTSFIVGGFATGAEIINAVNNPSFDTISDAVIDSIGLFSEGLAWSIGLDVAKTGAEKIGEEIEKGVQYYKDYKINEMYSAFLPENERIQNMFEPDNMFMKMIETGVKQLIPRF